MITCYLRYVIDPYKVAEFEHYGRLVMPLVTKLGGVHHGYFVPHEGPSNVGLALFSFPSLAEYERYRGALHGDEAASRARRFAEDTRCIASFERSFMRPVFE